MTKDLNAPHRAQHRWSPIPIDIPVVFDFYHDVPDVFYSQRARALVKAGKLESQGNLFFIRFSEVRLPKVRVTAK